MTGELQIEKISPEAVFFVDSRQFESGIYQYDKRIANSFLFYALEQEENSEQSEDNKEEAWLPKANP